MTDTPDLEIDAYLVHEDDQKILCDVRLWLPKRSSEDARIEVTAVGVDPDEAHPSHIAHLRSAEGQLDATPRFEATDILVRKSNFSGPRLLGGTRMTIGHIGRIIVRSAPMTKSIGPTTRDHVQFIISDIEYGLRQEGSMSTYKGDRRVFKNEPRTLRVSEGDLTVSFTLEQHWSWNTDTRDSISATSVAVLNLSGVKRLRNTPTEQLAQLAEDACVFLSLAARHRVLVHGSVVGYGTEVRSDWLNPLKRNRAAHLENAEGVLVDESEIDSFFEAAAAAWKSMHKTEKDAVRAAIFSVHPLLDNTLGAHFVAMFFALERLAKVCGSGRGTLREKIDSLLKRYEVPHGLLWPLFDSVGLVGLTSIRNHLAHGEILTGTQSGALAIANDHLQLWLEKLLLAILGYSRHQQNRDWLQAQLLSQREDILKHRSELWRAIKS